MRKDQSNEEAFSISIWDPGSIRKFELKIYKKKLLLPDSFTAGDLLGACKVRTVYVYVLT